MIKNLFFFRCIENQYKNDEINDEGVTKGPTRDIKSLALSTSIWEKNLAGNIKDKIIMENILRPQFGNLVLDKRKQNQGRPTKLSDRQKRNILRQAKELQEEVGNFSAKGVMVRAGIPPSIITATVCRVMRKAGLKWSHAQNKLVLTKSDLKLRLKFARKVRWKLPKDFWTGGVGFYLDGASFTRKMNLFDQARSPGAMVWRKPGQGLYFGFTAKGSHEGTGRSVATFMVDIAYGKGVIAAEQYFRRINAGTFSSFVYEHFPSMFKKCPNPK